MNAPVLLLGTAGIFAAVLVLVSRYRNAWHILSTAAALMLAAAAATLPIDQAVEIAGLSVKISSEFLVFGRSLLLNTSNRYMVAFLYGAAAVMFLASGCQARRRFYTLGLVVASGTAAALMVNPFLYAAIFVGLAVLAGSLLLEYSDRSNSSALLLVSVYSLAMVAIMLAGWTLGIGGVTAGNVELSFLTKVLLGFGIAVLLGIPPFSGWWLKASEDAAPAEWVFLSTMLQIAGGLFLLVLFSRYTFLRQDTDIQNAASSGGVLILWIGSLLAVFQKTPGRFLVYAVTADLGFMLLTVSSMTSETFSLMLLVMISRTIALSLVIAAFSARDSDKLTEDLRLPVLPAIAFGAGALTLSGFPLLPGFPARWGLLSTLWVGPELKLSVLLSMILLSLTSLRWMFRFIGTVHRMDLKVSIQRYWFLIAVLLIGLGSGVMPGILVKFTQMVLSGLNLLPGP